MASSHANTIATVLGTIGTVLWCIQLVPQIISNYRTKSTEGVPPLMMFLWALAGFAYGVYFLVQKPNVALMVQPEVFLFLSTVAWAQCLFYDLKWSFKKVLVAFTGTLLVFGGIQAVLIIVIQNSRICKSHTNSSLACWPLLIFGIGAGVLIAIGLIPPYIEIYRRHGRVVGLNFIFLAMDSSGAIFSISSLLVPNQTNDNGTKKPLDIIGIILYVFVPVLEFGIFLSQVIWYLSGGRRVLRSEKEERMEEKERGNIEGSASLNEAI
ncbi:PQ loop repeat-domain-containing protein [Dipodascopsis uninucleata]